MDRPKKYPDELREPAVRLVFESGRPIAHVAEDLGAHEEALRTWVRQERANRAERDQGPPRRMSFIDEHRCRFGVEPIWRVLEFSAPTYYACKRRPPSRRQVEDERLLGEIRRVQRDSGGAYGSRRTWKQLGREGSASVGRRRAQAAPTASDRMNPMAGLYETTHRLTRESKAKENRTGVHPLV
jgi:hypothetical protein